MKNVNWLAVLAAVIASMAIGFLWYGALFQADWMAGNGITMEGEKAFKDGVEMPSDMTPMIFNTIAMFVYALFMHWLTEKTGDTTWQKGATLGAVIGIISCIGVYINNMFAMDSSTLSRVDGSYILVLFTVIGAIIGGWRKSS
jgi:hypothetical protein